MKEDSVRHAAHPALLSAVHVLTDLTLGSGEIVHDYLKA